MIQAEILQEIMAAARYAQHRTVGVELRAMQARPTPPMGAVGRWFVTPHAVNQYIAKYARGMSYEQALGQIINDSERARKIQDLPTGAELWRGPDWRSKRKDVRHPPSRVLYCVMPDSPGLPVLVTVLQQGKP